MDNVGDISDLLDIVERTYGHPRLKAIHDKAYAALVEIAKEIEDAAKPEPIPDPEPTHRPVVEEERVA